jgi:hypothetical protein
MCSAGYGAGGLDGNTYISDRFGTRELDQRRWRVDDSRKLGDNSS